MHHDVNATITTEDWFLALGVALISVSSIYLLVMAFQVFI